jgi:hypothetical protein
MRELYILAGQSNMSGRGVLSELPAFANAEQVWVYGTNGAWRNPGAEPVDDATGEQNAVGIDTAAAASPAMAFADSMVGLRGVEIGLVPCAKGGSAIGDWKRNWNIRNLYGSMLQRARYALATCPGAVIKGVLVFQGESDTSTENAVLAWSPAFSEFVAAIRQDLNIPELPVVFTQLGPTPPAGTQNVAYWDMFCEWQASMTMKKLAMVSARDLTAKVGDPLHLTTASLVTLGQRYATAMHQML